MVKFIIQPSRLLSSPPLCRRLATASKDKKDTGFVEQPPSVVPSVCYAPGETMRNINIFVNQPEPQAMADSEYPSWIYDCLHPETKEPSLTERVRKMRKEYCRKRNLMSS